MEIEVGQIFLTGGNEYEIKKVTALEVTYELKGNEFTISRRTMEDLVNGRQGIPFRAILKTRVNQHE